MATAPLRGCSFRSPQHGSLRPPLGPIQRAPALQRQTRLLTRRRKQPCRANHPGLARCLATLRNPLRQRRLRLRPPGLRASLRVANRRSDQGVDALPSGSWPGQSPAQLRRRQQGQRARRCGMTTPSGTGSLNRPLPPRPASGWTTSWQPTLGPGAGRMTPRRCCLGRRRPSLRPGFRFPTGTQQAQRSAPRGSPAARRVPVRWRQNIPCCRTAT
mmetsp:Transcript_3774/g.8985  ORF Transcript_3774/g.8985 Transcript_3774/m.8985 type:complete len:215 (+) Transcript_3774:188-832(+)